MITIRAFVRTLLVLASVFLSWESKSENYGVIANRLGRRLDFLNLQSHTYNNFSIPLPDRPHRLIEKNLKFFVLLEDIPGFYIAGTPTPSDGKLVKTDFIPTDISVYKDEIVLSSGTGKLFFYHPAKNEISKVLEIDASYGIQRFFIHGDKAFIMSDKSHMLICVNMKTGAVVQHMTLPFVPKNGLPIGEDSLMIVGENGLFFYNGKTGRQVHTSFPLTISHMDTINSTVYLMSATSGRVATYDLVTHQIVKQRNLNVHPSDLKTFNGKVYILSDQKNSIYVLNENLLLETHIPVKHGPASMIFLNVLQDKKLQDKKPPHPPE